MADGGGDHLSPISSVTQSDEEENVVEELVIQTPEILTVSYSGEDLDKLVSFVQRMTVLFALDHRDWSEQTVSVIKSWLLDVQCLMLTVFYDGNTLTACLTFPLSPVQDLVYFLREPNQVFTVDEFHDEVVFGTIHEDIDGSLLGVLEKVYAPIFFQYGEWSENVKSHLCSCLHDFLSFLTGLHYKLSGMTILYVPNEGHGLAVEAAIKDREMIKRLETVAVHWASQIRTCLSDKKQLVPYELLCPFDEFDFWLYRYEVLQGLNSQLNHADLLRIIHMLTQAQSVYIKQILELTQECTKEMNEARSNINYLQLLVKPCKNLDDCESPAKVPHVIPEIIHTFRYIWLKSEFYNTKESIAGLFRALSNQIIIYCRNKVNISHVLGGNPRFGIKMADMSIDCCLSYKAIYDIMSKQHAEKNPAVGWDLDNATIFNHVDAFIKRLEDLIDICESMIVFGRMDETEEIQKPLFGGNRGQEFERTIEEVENIFNDGLGNLEGNSKEVILDVHNKQWYQDLDKYRKMVQDIEEIVENLISNVFLSVCNVEEGIEALATLYYFSYRRTLRPAYIRKTSEVWNMFITEITDTNKRMLEQAKDRASWLPKHASKAITLKINLDRITHLMNRFKAAKWMPDVSQAKSAMIEYETMQTSFTKNIQKVFEKWIDDIGYEFLSKLDRPLMIRSKTHQGLLECNIDRSLLEICEEARYFEMLGFTIPVNVNQVYSKYKTIKLVYESVMTVVLDYNKILDALSPQERKLFKALIMTCDKKIAPGLSKLTWGGELSDAYIAECVKYTGSLQSFVDLYKAANNGIAGICEKICDTPVLKFTMNSLVELKDLIKHLEKYRNEATVKLMEHYNTVIDFIVAVYRGFETNIRFMAKEWYDYIVKFDSMMQEALVMCAKNSLQSIYSALHGDGSVGPSPILSMTVDIEDKKIIFRPEIQEITAVLGGLLDSIVEAISYFPRITEKLFPDLEEKEDPYHSIIKNDSECLKIQECILDEVRHNERELMYYLDTWLNFRSIWEVNKDEFMAKYEEADTPAETFDANIGRYSEVANQVSMQEAISTVYFIVVNSNNLKNSILMHIDDWQKRHTELLRKKAKEKIGDIYEYMKVNSELILTVPKTIEDMKKSVMLFERLTEEAPIKEAEFSSILEHFVTLDKYEVLISAKMRGMVANLHNEWKDYLKKLKEAEDMLGNSKDDFKLSLLRQADVLKEVSKSLLEDFLAKAPTSPQTSCTTALSILKDYRRQMIELYDAEGTIISNLSVFHINQPENMDLRKLDKEMKILDEIWDLVYQWETSWQEYKTGNFWEIILDDMENFAITLYRKLNRLCKQYKDRKWDILEYTRKQVDGFRRTLPLILALKNPAMRSRHWDRVRNLVKMDFDENSAEFNLESIIVMDFQAYSDDIQDISNAATMELQIENGIKNIADTWETMAIEIVPFKGGVYRIKSVEDCFQALEENVVQISTMKATRFVEPFAKEVDYWEKTLSYIMETLEQALIVQRQWLYLENIFAGEDIKKQLPEENARFDNVTFQWKKITYGMFSAETALKATHLKPPNYLLDKLNVLADQLEFIQRALEVYLEKKRQIFPRFYFISNDDLLEILGNSKKPDLIQTHLKKLFDNLYKIKLDKIVSKKIRWESSGMFSDDGEYVEFVQTLHIDGPSEIWLNDLETEMRTTLRDKLRLTRNSLKKLLSKRDKWLAMWPGQMCLTSSQIQWTSDCTRSLMLCKMVDEKKPLKKLKKKQNQVLAKLSEMSRKEQPKQIRLKVNTLITIEIHGRDVIERMYKLNCKDTSHFEWFSQLRFYWDREHDNCVIRQTNTENYYGYEYTGNSGRLVITPLTDRCYITLTTALHLNRGGSPKGPAGTGKTETVKDLGKALGMWVIVTNCSEGLDYKSIGKNFSGLAQTGCWGCFDEFNRINVEVLSVVAQQILSILSALAQKLTMMNFEGELISIKPTVGLFITMNPGYAGRTELPDNLKSMFRPISMIVPDNVIIAENLLFSDGFQNTKSLARKVFTLYELAKQQLSKQCHYDFGLRSMVALLRYAGLKRRQLASSNEEEVVYLAMKDMNMARLTANDLPLFIGIMSDIFPGVTVPSVDYQEFKTSIEEELLANNLQTITSAVSKVIELYETKNSRHSVMVLGDTGTAKSTTWAALQGAFARMKKLGISGWTDAVVYPINPKALNLGELYGEYNLGTGEWLDGVLSAIMRTICADESPTQKWMLFDGPVDAVWIENMNSVMDDNKVLTLVNSERITMPAQVSLLFEVADLSVASPATVSRCGMVYHDYHDWGWRPYVRSWLQKQHPKEYAEQVSGHFYRYLDKILEFKRHNCKETVPTNELNCVMSLCRLLDCLATKENGITVENEDLLETMSKLWFLFCLIWSICATVDEEGRLKIDAYIREMEGVFPIKDTVYDYYVDPKQRALVPWEDKLSDNWRYNKEAPFYKIIVPTVDTVRYEFLVSKLLAQQYPVMLVGPVGTGKSSTAVSVTDVLDREKYSLLALNMSAQTTANNLQESIESRTEKRTKGVFVPIGGKTMICFMDDFNMPAKDTYGSQPPLELIRQWIDYAFWYDRKNQKRVYIKQMLLMVAMGPPGGGRQSISSRTMSRFSVINMTFPTESTITRIFGTMLKQKLSDFPEESKQLWKQLTSATLELYTSVSSKMLPTPAKIHYLFNLRDISRVFQGLLRSHNEYHMSRIVMLRLWLHECFRVFSDRLVDHNDLGWFQQTINDILGRTFDTTFVTLCSNKSAPIFGDFISSYGYYEDLVNMDVLRNYMQTQLEDYNNSPGVARINLVFFREAIEHITRIVRVVSQPRGNMLMIAIGGSGRQVLSKLAAYIAELNTFQIEITKKYQTSEFREDLKTLYKICGVKNRPTSFLFTGEQVVESNFLEIMNNMLSTGEINLFKPDEFEEIKTEIEPRAKKNRIHLTTDALYSFFMETVRTNLHLIICLSPVGANFRVQIRQYPALINCTTTNWLRDWPQEALLEVAQKFLSGCKLDAAIVEEEKQKSGRDSLIKSTEEKLQEGVANVCSIIHSSVVNMADIMLNEMKRHYYVTPVNYLELVSGFQEMLERKRAEVSKNANTLRSGLSKIQDTQDKVATMSDELKVSQEQVIELQAECEEFLVVIQAQTAEVDTKRQEVEAKAKVIEVEKIAAIAMAEQAQEELNKTLPAFEAAIKALDSLNKRDLTELKSYGRPSYKIEKIVEAVMILLGKDTSWTEARKVLGEQNFLNDLKNFDKDNISDKTLKRIAPYTQNPELEPEKVEEFSLACKSFSIWIRAIENYAKVYRVVAPKKAAVDEAMASLQAKEKLLQEAESELAELDAELSKLKADFNEKTALQDELKAKAENLRLKVERAVLLVESLAGNRERWIRTVSQLDVSFGKLVGDCLLSAAFVCYVGPFDTKYREELLEMWRKEIITYEIPNSEEEFDIMTFLCDAVTIREWNIQGLPSDDFSTENGILVTEGARWPLVIDPQTQAQGWIKNLEKKDLKIIDFGQTDYIKTLESALQFGKPVLLQNVAETLDPALNPILKKAIIFQGGQQLIKFNDKMISYNSAFRFYITTKLSNPHYPPEISTKTTLVNFAIKESGLQAQLLGIIVRKERPVLEEQKDNLVMNIAKNRRTLINLDNEILRLLNESRGSILDDDELFTTLQISRRTAVAVAESLSSAEVTEMEIDHARQGYQPAAHRAAILFFVLMDMSRIDPMYQFSLNAYVLLFTQSIERSLKNPNLAERILNLNEFHTFSVYKNTCRGLFERHKLLFSCHMCAKIMEAADKLNLAEYDFLLKGGIVLDRQGQSPNPWPQWISESAWDNITELDKVPGFHGIIDSFEQYPREWREWYSSPTPENVPLIGEWKDVCNDFQKMLIVRCLRPDRMTFCMTTFIINILGPKFVEPPMLDLKAVVSESLPQTPLIFVLSPGVDPTSALIQLAEANNMSSKLHSLSLGQGQAPIATKILIQGAKEGNWVFLANCHLSLSWMPQLDKIVETLQSGKVHRKFRLWLSSSPHPEFPISILQAGIKMTTEPPSGIKANMKRLYNIITEEQFNRCEAKDKYKRLLFALCFFHTILLERKKFQQLGWNVIYGFNDSDFEVSENLLTLYLNEYKETPWDALKYLIAGVNYGGHVTDDWDRRLLTSYINQFFNDNTLQVQNYKLSSLTTYYIPREGTLQSYADYIQLLPNFDKPEAFGQHPNADIASQITETRALFETLVSLQGQSAAAQGESKEEKILQLAQDIETKIPDPIDYENTSKLIGPYKQPLDVVLLQEIERYNNLLVNIKQGLTDLQKGIKGLVVMSTELEDMYNAMYEGKVPSAWLKTYASLKPLGSWARDLVERISHFSLWAKTVRPPTLFWLAAYTFPTGFLTAVLQTSARITKTAIDELSWEFTVLIEDESTIHRPPQEGGVYIRGFYLEGAGWHRKNQCLQQPQIMELICPMPVIQFKPVENLRKRTRGMYQCPTYYYSVRAGSFVIAVDLKAGVEDADFWIRRGTALLLSLAT